jgi:hypothetical protein
VEQQVSLSLYDQRPKQTHKRLFTSHQAGLPKPHYWTEMRELADVVQ